MYVMLVGPEFEENLSLRYLAAALQQAGHTAGTARFDSPEYVEGVVQQVLRERPGLVGFSMVFQVRAREFFTLARALRQAGYAGHITAGGHFATFACEPLLNDLPELDSIIRQEGETTLVALADALERGVDNAEIGRIPGMVMRGEMGDVVLGPPRQQVANLDTLPFPIRDAAPERHLGVPTAFLVGSRGCYADCEYCSIFAWHEAAIGKRYRMRSVTNIAEEMEWLYHQRGVRFFVFHDDNFFLPKAEGNRKRFEALRTEIRGRRLNDIGLMLKLRPNDCDRENMLILKEIGLLRAFVGIENASQRQLKSLGRDSTVEDVEACLAMLRELDIYATYNILLFDPYTTLDDIAVNLRFLRANPFFPFNWCKVEPYAGTALEKRYGQEGRLRGDYLGYDYTMDDARARLMYDLLLPAFYYRNFDYYGLANLNIGLGYHRQLLKHFYPDRCASDLCRRVQMRIEAINTNTLDLLEQTYAFVRDVDLEEPEAIRRFGEQLRQDSFLAQHTLSAQVEAVLREVERAAGVRQESPVGIAEAFTPLAPAPENAALINSPAPKKSHFTRRRWLMALGSGLVWVLTGCGRRSAAPSIPPNSPAVRMVAPQGAIHIASGHPETVASGEPFLLEAVLEPEETPVLGEPRITSSGGQVLHTQASQQNHRFLIEYRPQGGSRYLDPNVTITVAWTVRGKDSDTVVLARAFIHVKEDGSYAFGYETPRPTIAEMAAPPIRRGPNP